MIKLPKYLLFGQDDPKTEAEIQPTLILRQWSDISTADKQIAFQELENNGWLEYYSGEILTTIEYLNHHFLRQCPGKHLHGIKPENDRAGMRYNNDSERMKAALTDFEHIFLQEKSDALVFRMLSKFAECYIDGYSYRQAAEAKSEEDQKKYTAEAFRRFDALTNCLNHIFEQFSINQLVTRSGFVPRQDTKISEDIFVPVLRVLADPKWRTVNSDLAKMFEDYRDENYPEVITKAHVAIQRFLQIIAGEEGKNGKGEVGKLFQEAKNKGLIPINHFTEPLVNVIQGFIVSERATNSTAKPTLKATTASDALLMMNVIMVFLQYCLQNTK
ncbi:MAG: hypothetical protein NTZ38_02845 [Candidatus Taylorbacteria bacterium]|nr:hypothetical protein [Candidatus Taylorbacteria bacterium]